MEDLISVLPFGGTFDLVELKGSTLFKAFEHSVRRYGESSGEFLQVSGTFFHLEDSRTLKSIRRKHNFCIEHKKDDVKLVFVAKKVSYIL